MTARLRLLRSLLPVLGRTHRFSFPIAGYVARAALLDPPTRRRLYRTYGPLCGSDPGRTKRAAARALSAAAQYYVDLASLPYRDMRRFADHELDLRGKEKLALLQGDGPRIILGGHTAGAELTLRVLPVWGVPFTALVEPLEPPERAAFMTQWRAAPGARYVAADRQGLRECLKALQHGGLVALMADRDIQGNGICVNFFDRAVRFPRGPWELSARTGARVVPVLSARTTGGRVKVSIEDPIPVLSSLDREQAVKQSAQTWANVLERHIEADPGQWIVLEDFWKNHGCG